MKKDRELVKPFIMVVRSAVHTTKGSSKNRATAPPPKPLEELPAALKEQQRVSFDKDLYDSHGCVVNLLQGDNAEPVEPAADEPQSELSKLAIGSFPAGEPPAADEAQCELSKRAIGSFPAGEPRRLENLELPAMAYRDSTTQAVRHASSFTRCKLTLASTMIS